MSAQWIVYVRLHTSNLVQQSMKLVKKAIEKDQSGFVTLIAEDAEDMWHAYNLISKGDGLKATTIRYDA
jgi:stalled ribosome rescue protein Dom34